MFKKTIIILVLFLNIISIPGCYNYKEMDEEVIVTGLAIDKGQNGKRYHITVEMVKMVGGGKDAEIETKTAESDGEAFISIMRNLICVTAKKTYFGQCETIVLGEEIAKEGINSLVDFALSEAQIRLTIDFLVAKEMTGNEIIKQKGLITPITSYGFDTLLDNDEKYLSNSTRMPLNQLVNALASDGASPVMPALEVAKTKDYTTYRLSGLAVFKKDKLIGYLDNEESKYYLFATDRIRGGTIDVFMDEKNTESVSLEIINSRTKVEPEYKDGKLTIKIKTNTEFNIGELGKNVDYIDEPGREKLKNQTQINIETNIKKLVNKVQNEFSSDIFLFSEKINKDHYNTWQEIKDDWEKIFSSANIDVESKVKIKSSGLSKKAKLKIKD